MGTNDDDYDDYDVCDHTEYEVDWDGRAECICGKRWWLTAEQHEAYDRMMAEWYADCDRQMRREKSWFGRAARWLHHRLIRPRIVLPPKVTGIDDEIPF